MEIQQNNFIVCKTSRQAKKRKGIPTRRRVAVIEVLPHIESVNIDPRAEGVVKIIKLWDYCSLKEYDQALNEAKQLAKSLGGYPTANDLRLIEIQRLFAERFYSKSNEPKG